MLVHSPESLLAFYYLMSYKLDFETLSGLLQKMCFSHWHALNSKFKLLIHPSIFCSGRVTVGLGPVPAFIWWETGFTLAMLPACCSPNTERQTTSHTHNRSYLESPVNLTYMSLDCGRETLQAWGLCKNHIEGYQAPKHSAALFKSFLKLHIYCLLNKSEQLNILSNNTHTYTHKEREA